MGIRIFKGTRCVSGSASSLAPEAILGCASKVADALTGMPLVRDIVLRERLFGNIHPVRVVPGDVCNAEKIDYLRQACLAAKGYSDEISQVSGTFLEVDHKILIATSEGLFAQDRQIRTRVIVSSIASGNGENQDGAVKGWNYWRNMTPRLLAGRLPARQSPCCTRAISKRAPCL